MTQEELWEKMDSLLIAMREERKEMEEATSRLKSNILILKEAVSKMEPSSPSLKEVVSRMESSISSLKSKSLKKGIEPPSINQ